ncbi:MAG: nucleotidyl transferase AbiEii/AbiGii toxin family protein [Patescibacteria group bacterium]|jgi:predicted nucleotidyltransferase component of viral defense system|nr:nucleotidyl transferase AbiEii/AbiGii toxin family protein [Patescibacteria group bacterium]
MEKSSISTEAKSVLDKIREKVSFLFYSQALLFPLVDFGGVKMASEKDIAAMKLSAISSRGSKKDFIDFYFLLKKYSLEELLEVFEKKYKKIKYNKVHLLKSLAYFSDAEEDPIPVMIEDVDWEEIKKELKEKIAEFLRKQK